MSEAFEEIREIISTKGNELSKADLKRIKKLAKQLEFPEEDMYACLCSTIWQTVNGPDYKGDAKYR